MDPQRTEIVSTDAEIAFGQGWYPVERFGNSTFRWANNDAELTIAAVQPVEYKVQLTLEPGPGVGVKPFDLEVSANGERIATVRVKGKETVAFGLPPLRPAVYRIVLHVAGGGARTPGETRTLNFRIFAVSVVRGSRDVLPVHQVLGKGWYPLENFGGKQFRWVNNDAEVSLAADAGNEHLVMNIEPGPGVGSKPFVLQIQRADGTKLSESKVDGQNNLDIPWPKGEKAIRLHVDSEGTKSAGDPRVLNFRVFAGE